MFIPKETSAVKVPFFEDARSDDGWQGYATTKSIETLKREVMEAISRLGGNVFTFQQGTFAIGSVSRDGYQIKYSLDNPNGKIVPGVIEVAALPVRERSHHRAQYAVLHEKSLKMALYMLRTALDGLWFLQQLSPGYAALMPWMLVDGEHTVTQMWMQSPVMAALMPPQPGEFAKDQ